MHIKLSKKQWEFIGKKAGWDEKNKQYQFSTSEWQTQSELLTIQKNLQSLLEKLQKNYDFNQFPKSKARWINAVLDLTQKVSSVLKDIQSVMKGKV